MTPEKARVMDSLVSLFESLQSAHFEYAQFDELLGGGFDIRRYQPDAYEAVTDAGVNPHTYKVRLPNGFAILVWTELSGKHWYYNTPPDAEYHLSCEFGYEGRWVFRTEQPFHKSNRIIFDDPEDMAANAKYRLDRIFDSIRRMTQTTIREYMRYMEDPARYQLIANTLKIKPRKTRKHK